MTQEALKRGRVVDAARRRLELRIPVVLWEKLDAEAKRTFRPVATLIYEAVIEMLNKRGGGA